MTGAHAPTLERPAAVSSPDPLTQALDQAFNLRDVATTEVLLIRHAEPDYGAIRRGGDPFDPPLTARGRAQAMRLAERLGTEPVDAIYTSTMRRAFETAAVVAVSKDLPMTHIADLDEIRFDKAASEVPASGNGRMPNGDVIGRLMNTMSWSSIPGLEPVRQFRHRTIQALEAIVAGHTGERVAIVCHGGVINAYLTMLLDIRRDLFFLPDYTSISVVRVLRDRYAVQRLNDATHLSPALSPRQKGG